MLRVSSLVEVSVRPGQMRSSVVPTAAQGTIVGVPTISRFFGIVIAMFFDDHGPPHFHARHAGGSAKIRIDPVEVIDSSLARRQLRLVLAWAELIRTGCSRTGGSRVRVRHFAR